MRFQQKLLKARSTRSMVEIEKMRDINLADQQIPQLQTVRLVR